MAEKRDVLKNINLTIGENEIVGILGQSGSGKTTLIQHFNGLLKPTGGKIFLEEKTFWTKEISMAEIRRKVGLVFQFPENQFFEETVSAEIAFGLRNLGVPVASISERVKAALEMVRMDYERMHRQNPHLLSAGEKRRVALASILAMRPKFLVLDEPTAGLDVSGIRMLKFLVREYLDGESSIVIVSHNLELLFEVVHRLIILHLGQVVFDGKTQDLLQSERDLAKWGLQLPRYLRFLPLVNTVAGQSIVPSSRKHFLELLD
jgi:energy-coupling factor transport system ATP-binding protein